MAPLSARADVYCNSPRRWASISFRRCACTGSSASGACPATPSTWWCRTPNTILKNLSASRSAWPSSAMTVLPRSVMAWSRACAIWAMT
ncbi:hypothetical protein CCL24_12115, partial [Pseudomonas congelans]